MPPKMSGPMRHQPGFSAQKAKNFKGTVKKLSGYLSEYKFSIFIVLLFAVGSVMFSVVGPLLLGNTTTELYSGIISKINGGQGINFQKIGTILLVLTVIYILSALLSYIQGFTLTGITQKLTYRLRKEISAKIHNMPFKYFDSRNHGEVLSIITNDIDTLSQNLNQGIVQMITSAVTVVGIFVMMFFINWIMALVVLTLVPLSLLCVSVMVKHSQEHFRLQQKYLGHVNGQIEEVFGAQNIVRAFNAEQEAIHEFDNDNEMLFKSGFKAQFVSGLMFPIMIFAGNIGYVAVAVIGGYLAYHSMLTVGNIQSFIQYTRQFTHPLGQLAQISSMLQSTVAAAERVFEFLESEEESPNAKNPVSAATLKGNVEFRNVQFGYNKKIIIKNFSSKIKEGQKIAIVGPTGAGKTTMIKLLMRFYDVNGGEILVDGHNINDFARQDIRSIFGMVLQDTWLYNDTVMENIRYGKLGASDNEVIEAAKAAYVHHFIKTLPCGYEMVLSEEAGNISQGQKQLLTIARAILADPKILILDEATSSVDTRTEQRIQKAMDNLMKGRTSFIIAHRLSTIRNADLILVMNNGDIVEQGTHEQLIGLRGFYEQLYNSQFERTL